MENFPAAFEAGCLFKRFRFKNERKRSKEGDWSGGKVYVLCVCVCACLCSFKYDVTWGKGLQEARFFVWWEKAAPRVSLHQRHRRVSIIDALLEASADLMWLFLKTTQAALASLVNHRGMLTSKSISGGDGGFSLMTLLDGACWQCNREGPAWSMH